MPSIIFLTFPFSRESNHYTSIAPLHKGWYSIVLLLAAKNRIFLALIPQNIPSKIIVSSSTRKLNKSLIYLGTKIPIVH